MWTVWGWVSLPFCAAATFVWYTFRWPAVADVLSTPFARLTIANLVSLIWNAALLVAALNVGGLLGAITGLAGWGLLSVLRDAYSDVKERFRAAR